MSYHDPIIDKSENETVEEPENWRVNSTGELWMDDTERIVTEACSTTSTQMYILSRQGLWSLLIFLLISVAAFTVQDFNLYKAFPEPVLQILGCPPPAFLIHLALTIYSLTVVVSVLIRMATGDNPVIGWLHLPCRSIFYIFYLAAGSLTENFVAVIGIGILLYVLEQFGIWTYMYKYMREAELSN